MARLTSSFVDGFVEGLIFTIVMLGGGPGPRPVLRVKNLLRHLRVRASIESLPPKRGS